MNRKQKRKLIMILCILGLLSVASALILFALKQNINLFYTPTELKEASITSKRAIRVGGYVKDNSVLYDKSGETIYFIVTDRKNDIPIQYKGLLPNLFREGQTVVVTGKLTEGVLMADQVLAKHDEKYIPKPIKDTMHAT
jgi:cytochrome c-type biogenesis protein CcmE